MTRGLRWKLLLVIMHLLTLNVGDMTHLSAWTISISSTLAVQLTFYYEEPQCQKNIHKSLTRNLEDGSTTRVAQKWLTYSGDLPPTKCQSLLGDTNTSVDYAGSLESLTSLCICTQYRNFSSETLLTSTFLISDRDYGSKISANISQNVMYPLCEAHDNLQTDSSEEGHREI